MRMSCGLPTSLHFTDPVKHSLAPFLTEFRGNVKRILEDFEKIKSVTPMNGQKGIFRLNNFHMELL